MATVHKTRCKAVENPQGKPSPPLLYPQRPMFWPPPHASWRTRPPSFVFCMPCGMLCHAASPSTLQERGDPVRFWTPQRCIQFTPYFGPCTHTHGLDGHRPYYTDMSDDPGRRRGYTPTGHSGTTANDNSGVRCFSPPPQRTQALSGRETCVHGRGSAFEERRRLSVLPLRRASSRSREA